MSLKLPKNLKELSNEERREFLNSFDIVFSDIDGVILQASPLGHVPRVDEGIKFLEDQGKTVKYVTNNSIHPIKEPLNRFHKYGIQAKEEDIIHPAQTIVEYLRQINFKGLIYCLASNAFKDHLKNAGYELLDVVNKLLILKTLKTITYFVAQHGYRKHVWISAISI